MSEPITNVEDAATALGALPVPQGPEPRTLERVEHELDGANLSLWEEEQDNARLRLALASAQRGRRELRAQLAELLAERHTTNEALDDAVQALRERGVDRAAVLDDFIARCEVALSGCCPECDAAVAIVKGRKQAALEAAPVPEWSASPELGACAECGDGPSKWCPGCAKCSCVAEHDMGCARRVGA